MASDSSYPQYRQLRESGSYLIVAVIPKLAPKVSTALGVHESQFQDFGNSEAIKMQPFFPGGFF